MLNNTTDLYEVKEIINLLDQIRKEKRVENILNLLDRLKKENLISEKNYDDLLINAGKNYDILK